MTIYQNKTFIPNDLYSVLCNEITGCEYYIKNDVLTVNVIDDMFIKFIPENKKSNGQYNEMLYIIYNSENDNIRRGYVYMNTSVYRKEQHRIFMRSYFTVESDVEYLTKENEMLVNELLNKIFNILEIDGELKI